MTAALFPEYAEDMLLIVSHTQHDKSIAAFLGWFVPNPFSTFWRFV